MYGSLRVKIMFGSDYNISMFILAILKSTDAQW